MNCNKTTDITEETFFKNVTSCSHYKVNCTLDQHFIALKMFNDI